MKKWFIVLCLSFLFTGSVHAQVSDNDILISISPKFPNPNENVTATINSYSTDLNKSYITWTVNGKDIISNIGKKTFSFTMGGVGTNVNLSVTVETVSGNTITKMIDIVTSQMDMLWEAVDSYAPPFYKGKTFVSKEGEFKVVAMPYVSNQSGKVNLNDLSYLWTKDGAGQSNSSGWGKNSYIFKNTYLDRNNTIEVETSNIYGSQNASSKIILTPTNPEIVFYKNDPRFGINYENALDNNFSIEKEGSSIVATPYFFSPRDLNNLSFNWFLNDKKIETPTIKNFLSIKPESGQSGSGKIKINIKNDNTFYQDITKEITVRF